MHCACVICFLEKKISFLVLFHLNIATITRPTSLAMYTEDVSITEGKSLPNILSYSYFAVVYLFWSSDGALHHF